MFIKKIQLIKLKGLEKLTIIQCNYDQSHYQRRLFDFLSIHFPNSLTNSVEKRQAEFLAGRHSANLALRTKGIHEQTIAVGQDRCPIWPENISASITHTHNSAICVAAYKKNYHQLGIDLECWLSHKIIEEIKPSVIRAQEEKIIKKSLLGFDKAFTLVFSAKESLFKSLYPDVGYYFDFKAAAITSISHDQKMFQLILKQDLNQSLVSGMCFSGHYDFDDKTVLTLITIKK